METRLVDQVLQGTELTRPKARKPQSRRSRKADKPKAGNRIKTQIVMDRKLDFLLSSAARFRGIDRSELAAMLIEAGLKERFRDLYEALLPFDPRVATVDPKVNGRAKTEDPGAIAVSENDDNELDPDVATVAFNGPTLSRGAVLLG